MLVVEGSGGRGEQRVMGGNGGAIRGRGRQGGGVQGFGVPGTAGGGVCFLLLVKKVGSILCSPTPIYRGDRRTLCKARDVGVRVRLHRERLRLLESGGVGFASVRTALSGCRASEHKLGAIPAPVITREKDRGGRSFTVHT